MTILAEKMSSEGGDPSVLVPAETTAAQELSKGSRIRYTIAFLVSLAKTSAEKRLPRGIEPSILSELDDFQLDHSWKSSYDSDSESCHEHQHKGLLSSKNVVLLGPSSLMGVHGGIIDASPPKVEENILPLLHKSKEPYRPPHLLKAFWNDYKDEVWVSPEYLSENGQKQINRRDFPEVKKEAFRDNQKKNSSELDKKVEIIKPLDMSDEIVESLAPEHADTTRNHTTSPDIEENPAYCISCTEESELIAHGASNEQSTTVPDKHIKSTTDEASELYGCKIPAFSLGVLSCIGLERIFKPETTEIRWSMLWDGCAAEDGKQDSGNHHGSYHIMFLPETGTEQKGMTASSEQNITNYKLHPSDSTTDNNKLIFVSKGYAGQLQKNLTRELSSITSSKKGLQLTNASSCIRQSSVGASTMKNVPKTYSESCHEHQHKGLLSSENVGPGSLMGVHGGIADASPPKVEENLLPSLHKSKEPYSPPHLLMVNFPEVKKEAFQDKQKKYSSETILVGDQTFISNELLRKFFVYDGRIIVAYTGDVPIGRDFMQYIEEATENRDNLDIGPFITLVHEFRTPKSGECYFWIATLYPDGEPLLLQFKFLSNEIKLEHVKQVRPYKVRAKLVSGSGADCVNEYMKNADTSTPTRLKEALRAGMTCAIVKSVPTGGYISKIRLQGSAGIIQAEASFCKSMKYVIEHYADWIRDMPWLLSIIYTRSEQDQTHFQAWINSFGKRRGGSNGVMLGSPVAQLKESELTFAFIDLCYEKLMKMILKSGKENTTFLSGFNLREMEFENKVFYVSKPSKQMLESLKIHRFDEYDQIPNQIMQVGENVDNDDDYLSDIDGNDTWSFVQPYDL
ncbi:hypothetical protein OROHE_018258 [Orobanche hederae]